MSCLDCGLASKAVKHAGLFLLPKITGIRFQAENVSQPRFSFVRQKKGGGLCWFMLLHSCIKTFLPSRVEPKCFQSNDRRSPHNKTLRWFASGWARWEINTEIYSCCWFSQTHKTLNNSDRGQLKPQQKKKGNYSFSFLWVKAKQRTERFHFVF